MYSDGSYLAVSYGLSFDKAAAKHLTGTLRCRRTHFMASKELAPHSDGLVKLGNVLHDHHVGTRMGTPALTSYDGLITILRDI